MSGRERRLSRRWLVVGAAVAGASAVLTLLSMVAVPGAVSSAADWIEKQRWSGWAVVLVLLVLAFGVGVALWVWRHRAADGGGPVVAFSPSRVGVVVRNSKNISIRGNYASGVDALATLDNVDNGSVRDNILDARPDSPSRGGPS